MVSTRYAMQKNRLHALLLQPPPGDLTGPYPALCYLKSFAAAKNYSVAVRDLGIDAFHYLSETKQVQHLVGRAAELRKKLETKGFLTPAEQGRYHLLLTAMGIGLNTGLQDQVLGCFKNPKKFYDYHSYKKACRILDAFFRLLSAVHYPTIVTPSEYPTATMLKTVAKVLEHRKRRVNPYIHFYKDILFPQIATLLPSLMM